MFDVGRSSSFDWENAMKAWLLDKLEGVQKLRLAEVPEPTARSGEVVVSVLLAGLNPADAYLAIGQYPTKAAMPHVLGRDAIGIVQRVGESVTTFRPGDRVVLLRSEIGVNRPGTFAERVAVPVESLSPVPSGWTDEESAGAALVYLTAHQALSQWGELHPSVVLVTGASGGVGVATVQLAVAAGHTVIALSRSPGKREKLIALGAAHCCDPGDTNWPSALKKVLGDRRVDLAIDSVGGADFPNVISVLGHGGKVSVVGRLAGPVPEFNTASLFFRRIKIGGVAVGDYTPAESQLAWKAIVEALDRARVRPLVDSVYRFEDLMAAFDKLKSGPMGKVLVQVGSESVPL
jgi:NADPH2:quinone reductase